MQLPKVAKKRGSLNNIDVILKDFLKNRRRVCGKKTSTSDVTTHD